jgi:hypothetical protein
MKNLYLFILLIFFSVNLQAQSEKELAVAEAVEKFKNAMIDGERDVLYSLTSKALSYGHSNGAIDTQESFINPLVSGKSNFKTMIISDQTINIIDNTALVRHNLVADIIDNGNTIHVTLGVLLVWIEQDGQWKLLARQAVKLM